MNLIEKGQGPLVLFCHGFPETSHVWRNQLSALAAAGYRTVAPDLRGYGGSDRPEAVGAYTVLQVIGDMVALMDALGEKQAVIVGGDWGAMIAWQAALIRPDRFRAVTALGVPMMGRAPMLPSKLFPQTSDAWFYTHYFASPGLAERELEANVAATLRKIYFAASGDAGPRDDPKTPNPFGMVPRSGGLLSTLPDPQTLPGWLGLDDFTLFVRSFEQSGFRWSELLAQPRPKMGIRSCFQGLHVNVPAMYLFGERDTGLAIPGMKDIINAMPFLVPQLQISQVIPKAGHWLQQESCDVVNALLLGFLDSL
ncbi:alpha/beta hydrolase [Acinetobacter sp. ANC 4216]|uniref:alpha/beta fold hydrolase n=1 Tax=Acinetobacter sp. ANC 4216 TaxID=2529840 RepID=UPI001BC880C1|nr:alpha/beta hydrolase [Acinetobacter sp. ANC 4216]